MWGSDQGAIKLGGEGGAKWGWGRIALASAERSPRAAHPLAHTLSF